jgi:AraC family transcriptional regulator
MMATQITLTAARPAPGRDRIRRLGAPGGDRRITILNGHAREYAAYEPHGAFSLKWMPDGEAVYRVDGAAHRLSGDAMLLLNPGQSYEIEFVARRASESLCVFFSDALLGDAATAPDGAPCRLPTFPDLVFRPDPALATTLAGLRARFDDPDVAADALEEALLRLLERLTGVAAEHRGIGARIPALKPATRRMLAARLQRARDHIEAAGALPPTLDALAAVSCLSKFHLVRLFRAAFGCTPMRYAEACRIARAAPLLRDTRLTVAEIAAVVGYDSQSAFARAFRRQRGVTPRAFRAT